MAVCDLEVGAEGHREKGGANYGVLATRNPRFWYLSACSLPLRVDARQNLSLSLKALPRQTRCTPELGPDGSLCSEEL